MSMKHHSATIYKITYTTPAGGIKWVLWRGKDEAHAARSWQAMYQHPTNIIDTQPHKITWKQ